MSTILDKIVKKTYERVCELKEKAPLNEIKELANSIPKGDFEFEKALKTDDIAFICEIKKASPSKGIISKDFDYIKIAKEYEKAGASAISCLSEPYWFLGSDKHIKEISQNVSIPILRKDFTIDEYQIYEAKTIGASAVLLICSILDEKTLCNYIKIADELKLSTLVEAHNEEEIKMAQRAGARVIGVNNRDLKTFNVDINNSIKLRHFANDDIIFVSESGIKTAQDIENLRKNKINAVLIGETLMRAENKTLELMKLKGKNV